MDFDDFCEAFEAEVFALDGDEEAVGGGEGAGHEDAEGWGAVDDEEVVLTGFAERAEGVGELGEVVVGAGEFDLDPGEVHGGRDHGEALDAGGDDFVQDVGFSEERPVDAGVAFAGEAEGAGGVGLGVEVEEEDAGSELGEAGGEVYGSGGLSDPAFLVGDCDDFHTGGLRGGGAWCLVRAPVLSPHNLLRASVNHLMELTEKWLQSAAGWKAVKEARKIHGAGAVLKATYEPPLLQGIVQMKGKPSVAGMKIHGKFDIDNLCKCWEARRNGGLCEHSVAVALAIILGNEAVTGRPKESVASTTHGSPQKSAGEPEPLPAPISVFLPRDFVEQWAKGRTGATLGMGEPPKEPVKGTKILANTVGHSAEDTPFVAWLRGQGLVKLTTMLALPSELAGEMLGTLSGHPRVYRGAVTAPGKATALRVAQLPLRRRITLKSEGDNELWYKRKYTLQPVANKREGTVELQGDRPWLFAEATGMLIPVGTADSEAMPPFPVDLQWIAERLEGITQGYEIEDPEGILKQLSIEPARPVIRLNLEGSLRNLTAELAFGYADHVVKSGEKNDAFPIPVADTPGRFLGRSEARETAAVEMLEAAGFKAPDRQGKQFLSGEEAVMQFLGSASAFAGAFRLGGRPGRAAHACGG